MNRTSQLMGGWSGPLFCALFAIGMVPPAQFIPPPTAHDSLATVVHMYNQNTDRRAPGSC